MINFLLGKKLRFVILGLLLVIVIGFVASQPNKADYQGGEIFSIGSVDEKTQKRVLNSVTIN